MCVSNWRDHGGHGGSQRGTVNFRQLAEEYASGEYTYHVRGKPFKVQTTTESLAHSNIPRVALPKTKDDGELYEFITKENAPGHFPYTAGVFPFKRTDELSARMFAGEGEPERTNRRFHYLSQGQDYVRLSTAFDSVTLYGRDPARRPDIWGKVGNSGVSIATTDDAKRLYSGFDLCNANTSVSMTINGPAPIILAFFLNAAIDQQVEAYLAEQGKPAKLLDSAYRGELPEGHNGFGLATVGRRGDEMVDAKTYAEIKARTLQTVRGTVQADILKEDQAQNTCIFSTPFALKLMGDVQQYYIDHGVRNHYSVSISGYHIAEAGANPITQLALTLANGFTYVEYYRSRGMDINKFAPNLSFFFSNGLDPEYTVIGRVARRIWAVTMRDMYGADERSQKLKYHIQTSGRSLHAQEIDFNDIRTTLQALLAIQDNANSLHTNAYDEAITTPTEESVRRALAIQLIVNKESGWTKTENPMQGAYIVDELTDLVEEAVLQEFEAISRRGGVLGAMETMYQRGKIQDESMYYEHLKHDGTLPIIGVNTFQNPNAAAFDESAADDFEMELARATPEEKEACLERVTHRQTVEGEATQAALKQLQEVARQGGNVFEELMETVKVASLGQITMRCSTSVGSIGATCKVKEPITAQPIIKPCLSVFSVRVMTSPRTRKSVPTVATSPFPACILILNSMFEQRPWKRKGRWMRLGRCFTKSGWGIATLIISMMKWRMNSRRSSLSCSIGSLRSWFNNGMNCASKPWIFSSSGPVLLRRRRSRKA